MQLRAKAYAKLNLFLDVLRKRKDGYHDIDSVMQSVSLYDEITLSERSDGKVTVSYQSPSFSREDDIVFKAYEVFSEYSGYKKGVDIFIEKNIPTFAGLGGFSAVLATVLKLLNRVSEKNYSDGIMLSLCKRLGADVPFCYNGGTARTRGIGEEMEPLKTPVLYFVLLKEGEKQSTGAMYGHLDSLNIPPSNKIDMMLSGIEREESRTVAASVYNIFENCWDFEKMKSAFSGYGAESVFLSGSGPTTVAAFTERAAAEKCFSCMQKDGKNVFFAETVKVTGNITE